ncbi:DUF1289 domain-containing protein [Salinispirillum marinum]|uniref:DUF1289 domain-containing protein n=2 Tax=Saccharospirillaceae TaxID=255527 RepID=A0ABV8BJ70_9GAMM
MGIVQQAKPALALSPAGASPCIGICSVTVGDTVCRGCFRTLDDIAQWSMFSNEVLTKRLSVRQGVLERSFTDYFELVDEKLLLQQWKKYINCPPEPRFAVEAWIQLLHVGASKIVQIEAYGVRLFPQHQHLTLRHVWRTWRDSLLDARLFESNQISG